MILSDFSLPDELEPVFDRLLRVFAAELTPAERADPTVRGEALAILSVHALDMLFRALDTEVASPDRTAIESDLLNLASAARADDAHGAARRGVPGLLWTPTTRYQSISEARPALRRIDEKLSELHDAIAVERDLEAFSTTRLLPTNEEIEEILIMRARKPVVVETSIDGGPYRITLAGDSLVVVGRLLGDPERLGA